MGKASKWFRGLLGLKKPEPSTTTATTSSSAPSQTPITCRQPQKKKWSFVKSFREKEHHHNHQDFHNKPFTEKSRTGLDAVQSFSSQQASDSNEDPSKHAIAVAAATAAVADAAVAAAQAAAAVVKLTSSGRAITTNAGPSATTCGATASFGSGNSPSAYVSGSGAGYGNREYWAAVKIQSHFRAYLSRRALRALKALVKLQALVRGHIVRKQTADMLRRMQVLLRAQERARTGRAQIFDSPLKSNQFHYPGPATPEKFEHMIRVRSMKQGENLIIKRNGSKSNGKGIPNLDKANMGSNWMDIRSWEQEGSSIKTNSRDDERSDKILEVDNGKPHTIPKRRNFFHSSHLSLGSDKCSHSFTTSKEYTVHQVLSPSSCEVQSVSPLNFTQDDDELFCTADNSPQFYSASANVGTKVGPFTPTKSDGSRSCLSGCSDHPSYMSYTESSKAKMRSFSAPKQRPRYERSSSTKRYSIHGCGDTRMNTQRVSALHANFTSKAYPGSGRLDRLGMPLREEVMGFSGGHWHQY